MVLLRLRRGVLLEKEGGASSQELLLPMEGSRQGVACGSR